MLTEICAYLKNYFSAEEDRFVGDFSVVNGAVTPSVQLAENQYYRIVGSVFNDGVHRSDETLTDEGVFHGAVWKMRIPQAVIDLSDDIAAWQAENGSSQSANMSPFASESFGGYSYTKASGFGSASGGSPYATWQNMFANRLNPYRKIRAV